MVSAEKLREVSTMPYSRDVRGTGRKAVIAAYEERWGEGCIPVRPDRTILVSKREVPETQLVKNGDGKIIRISNAPLSGHR